MQKLFITTRYTTDMTRDPVHRFGCHLLPPKLWSHHDNTNVISCTWPGSNSRRDWTSMGYVLHIANRKVSRDLALKRGEDHLHPQNIAPQSMSSQQGSYGTRCLKIRKKKQKVWCTNQNMAYERPLYFHFSHSIGDGFLPYRVIP